ncbi:MAG: Triphosphoribosyl-dephospho-CoA synthetase [uncultured Rubrobacteraceae bacterium]|uniref:Triphosphoribosyl-dephospho-CoA synthetase n=1 Tax=uncultured Rubrobacteraceae bacterium TaxID=349277 RepID=A0A6J4Q4Z2_9ACTN|nr:MAG: Triphosphoribosyl-dephospho-CoA synthetase [uncultured Rubrobacteraceae bacterium]
MTEGNAPGPRVSPAKVASAAASALFLGYSAPMPGAGSRYSDGIVAHETRLLGVPALAAAVSESAERPVGGTVLEAVLGSLSVAGYADSRAAGYLAPLALAALLGERLGKVLAGLSHADIRLFARALEASDSGRSGEPRPRVYASGARSGTLAGALDVAAGAGRDATLRDAMRFAATGDPGDPMAREYAKGFEITQGLARPALFNALARVEATRPALVQAYLEVLAEVPDLDAASRAGREEAEEVSRMARGVLKAGGVYSRRGLQAITNLDGLLRSDPRLVPSATEPPVIAAAFLLALEHGSGFLGSRVRPAPGR